MMRQGIVNLLGRMTRLVPESLLYRVLPAKYRWDRAAMVAATPPETATRVFIGPVNSAGQGTRWARAVETLNDDVGAVSMAYTGIGEFGYPIDQGVPATGYVLSKSWQRAQKEAVERGFTHVLLESERHLFGRVFDQTVAQQVQGLIDAGLAVAFVSHGSDLRLPSRHAAAEPLSPFAPGEWSDTPKLEAEATRNLALLESFDLPVFVSTLGLMPDAPAGAEWLPVVIDTDVWLPGDEVFVRERPVVVHAPSKGVVKGTALIEPIMRRLHDEGLVEYRPISGVPANEMPSVYRDADIVLDQFRLGDYGVAACEAMSAERVVIGHVSQGVRDEVFARTGQQLPIVQATPDDLEAVVRQLVAHPQHGQQTAKLGREFVVAQHDGRRSAAALAEFLGVQAPPHVGAENDTREQPGGGHGDAA